MNEAPETGEEPPNLRFLRILVTVLTATMIAGLLIIIALIVTRFRAPAPFTLPDAVTLPEGTRPTAFTRGEGWYAVVTDAPQILIFGADGRLLQTVDVTAP